MEIEHDISRFTSPFVHFDSFRSSKKGQQRRAGVKIQTRRGRILDTTSPTLSGSSNGLSPADLNALTRVLDEHLKPLAPYPSIEHDFNEKHKAFLEANIPRFCLPKTHSECFPSKLYSHSSNTPLTSSPPVCDGEVFERQDVCIVLGCDGLFDVLYGEQIAELACPWMRDDGSWMEDPVFDSDSDDEVGSRGRRGGRGKGKEVVVEEWNEENLEKNAKSMNILPDAVEHAEEDADEDAEAEPSVVSSHSSESDSIFEPSPFTQLPSSHPPISPSSQHPPKTRSRRRQNGLGRHKNKGRLAELAALRLKSASDAMESLDNISIIVLFL
ncbi:hypothetical protein BLNAU_10898 [Blattamonas nauphoetae]|uniref:PPM-type phosphatase domain-containing protein n=1 Tax=Blattamonas nauphoetae TaxID=2049346 RepID=A0ABQ9XNT6_9EUKA|nr:hypothetical protein BLNAU_10898 [Blattamonas nauphoetae]